MSSPEYEGFGITDKDMIDAMDPLRRQGKRTKEEAIYGMWADSGSDEESGRAGLGMGGRSSSGKADYSKPVSFVSGGLKKSQEEMAAQEDEMPAERQSLPKYSSVKKVAGFSNKDFGDFERHTKGIGKRLLAKMGWEAGQGLGKNLQGIAKPVEAYVRKGKGALGFYGSERPESQVASQKELKTSTKKEIPAAAVAPQLGQWKKAPGEKKKVQYVVRSATDIAAEGDYRSQRSSKSLALDSAISSVKVIDLTGKEKVVYSGYSSLSKHHMIPDDSRFGLHDSQTVDDSTYDSSKPSYFDVPELRHNLKLLVSSAEDDVIDNLKKRDREQDQIACLAHDQQRLEEVIADEDSQISQLQNVVALVNGLETIKKLDEAMSLLQQLSSEFEDEYKLYGLDRLLYPVTEPLLRAELTNWNPLDREKLAPCFDSLCRLRQAFIDAEKSLASDTSSAQFDALIWEIWVPPVRQAVISRWNPRDPENLVAFFEKWQPFLPPWIWENICNQCLLPRILAEAENWNPVTDTLPIHSWVHPWLGLLADKLEPVYLPIRQKIGTALANWHPSDPSARILLQSWVHVWSDGHMRSFLLQHIGPKLAKIMQDFVINPRQQSLDAWKWMFDWIDLLPSPFFVSVLEKYFFPKWLQALANWLDTSAADYQEVTTWYIGWKNAIPALLVNEPNVKENLGKALAMMNQAITGGRAESVLVATPSYSAPSHIMSYQPTVSNYSQSSGAAVSFREVIERRAESCGLAFLPLNRRDSQQQVYQLGRAVLYIDRNVVFVSSAGTWAPVSLDELFNMA